MILGIDFSLTATGVCVISDGEAECATIKSVKEETWDGFPKRVADMTQRIVSWVDDHEEPAALIIESPSFASKSSSLDRIHGGWWLLVADFLRRGYDTPLLVTPAQVKKFATGKGNAHKEDVRLAVDRRYPDVPVSSNDEADALILAAIGAAVFGRPFNGALTKLQAELVEKVRLRHA